MSARAASRGGPISIRDAGTTNVVEIRGGRQADAFAAAGRWLAEQEGAWVLGAILSEGPPGTSVCRLELVVVQTDRPLTSRREAP